MSKPLIEDNSIDNKQMKRNGKQEQILVPEDNFDIIGRLPPEMVQNIFLRLPSADLRNALNVSPLWKDLASGEYFWKRKCRLDGYLMKPSCSNPVFENIVASKENFWEMLYRFNAALRENWRENNFMESFLNIPFTLTMRVPHIHYFDDEIFILSNPNNEVFIINYYSTEFVKVFEIIGKLMGDRYFLRKSLNFVIYINLFKDCLRVWSIEDGSVLLKIPMKPGVEDVVVHENLIFLLFCDCSCEILDIMTGKFEYSAKFKEVVSCVCFFANQVAIGTAYGNVKIINLESKTIVKSIEFSLFDTIRKIIVSGEFLICFTPTWWYVWNMTTDKMVHSMTHTLEECYSSVFMIDSTTVFMRNSRDLCLEAWDFVTKTCRFVIHNVHSEMQILTNDFHIFVASDEILIYCKITGKYVGQFKLNDRFTQIFTTNTKLAYRNFRFLTIRDYEKQITETQLETIM